MTDRSEIAESRLPTLASEPTENAESADPTEPIDSTEPTLAIDSTEPLEPMLRTESVERMDQRDPSSSLTRPPSVHAFAGAWTHASPVVIDRDNVRATA